MANPEWTEPEDWADCPFCRDTGWDYEAEDNCTCGASPPDREKAHHA